MNRKIKFNHHIIIKIAGHLFLFLFLINDVNSQVTNISGILNTIYSGIDSIHSREIMDPDTLFLKSIAEFHVGDTVLAYESAGAGVSKANGLEGTVTDIRYTGKYGIFLIKGIDALRKMVILNTSLMDDSTRVKGEVCQLVKVRTFKRVNVTDTLTCVPYDPVTGTGGVLVMMVEQSLTLNANIDVSGKGFPGADPGNDEYVGSCTSSDIALRNLFFPIIRVDSAARKGGGLYESTFSYLRGRSFATIAGGGGNGRYSGGGGGGHYNDGGKGGFESRTCGDSISVGGEGGKEMNTFYVEPGKYVIYMGGGGGTGTQRPSLGRRATKGGAGGGIIIIVSDTIIGNGKRIMSRGESVTGLATAGAGGGGAGGAIFLHAFKYNATATTLTLDVKGGDGGSVSTVPGEPCGPGGGGSGGLIWFNGNSIAGPVSYFVGKGVAGKYSSTPNGAASGGDGIAKNNLYIQIRGFLFNKVPGGQSICQDETPAPINAPPASGGSGLYSYLWEQSNDLLIWSNAPPPNNNPGYMPGVLTDSVYYRRIVYDFNIPRDTSKIVTIIVHPRLNNNIISPDTTVCSGLTANLIYPSVPLTGALGFGNYNYTWEQSSDNSTWAPATGVNNNAAYPTPALTDTVYYRRKVVSGSCSSTSNSVKISVLEPLLGNTASADQIICYKQTFAGFSVGTVLGGEPLDRKYKWQQNNTGTWIDTVADANFTPLVLKDTAIYRRIVISGLNNTCKDTSNEVTITVLPKITNNFVLNSSDSVYCAGIVLDSLRLNGTTPNGGNKPNFTYTWQKRLPSVAVWTSAETANTLRIFNAGVLYDTTYFRRLVFSGANDVCKDTSSAILMKVLPEIGNNIISSPQTICEGELPGGLSGGIITGGQPADRTYKWQKNSTGFWNDIGVTTPNYNPPVLNDTTSFRRIVFSGPVSGTCKDTSAALVIRVQNDITKNIINNLSPVYTCYNKAPALLSSTTKASGGLAGGDETGYSFTWLESINNTVWNTANPAGTNPDYQAGALIIPKYFRRYVESGACKDTSLMVKIDTTYLPVLFSLTAQANPICYYQADPYSQINLTIKEGYSPYIINYSDSLGGTGSVNFPSRLGSIRSGIINPSNDSLLYSYRIDKITDKNGCEATSDNLDSIRTRIKVFTTPHPSFSTKSIEVCDSLLTISPLPSFGAPQWQFLSSLSKNMYVPVNLTNTSIDLKADFSVNNDFNSEAALVYREFRANCNSTDTIHAILYKNPESIGNLYRVSLKDNVPFGDTLIIFISDNQDLKADPVSLGFPQWKIISGPAQFDSTAIINTRISRLNLNTPSIFEYSINNGVCPPNIKTVTAIRKDFFVYDGFSPNDDGINDVLYAQGLYDEEIQFKFQIYSSSGSFIKEISRKDVSDFDFIKNEVVLWDGTTKFGGANNKIMDGTYYYVLTVKYKGQKFDKKGYLIVKR